MGMFDTDGKEVAQRCLQDALKATRELQKLAQSLEAALQIAINEKDGRGFPILWATMLREKLDAVMCEISRCNGAVLVRATEKSK